MLERIENQITYTSNKNLSDSKIICREYATAKTLSQLLEDFESSQASEKELHIYNYKMQELNLDLNYKQDLEEINQAIKELESKQDTLTFKAYVEESKKLANRKNALFEKYSFLKTKIYQVNYENTIVLNELKDLTTAFTNYVSRRFVVSIVLEK